MSDPNLDAGPVNDPTQDISAGSDASGGSPSEIEKIRQQLSASSREAKRLKAELDALQQQRELERQQMELFRQQMLQQHQKPPEDDLDVNIADEDVESLYEGVLKEDKAKIKNVLAKVAKSSGSSILNRMSKMSAEQQEIQAAVAFVKSIPQLDDPNSALSKAALQEYFAIINNPIEMAGIKQTNINFNGIQFNPFAYKLAALKALAKIGQNANSSMASRAIGGDVTGGSGDGVWGPGDQKPTFNPSVHLSEQERKYVLGIQARGEKDYTFEKYWNNLEKATPGIQEARLKAGRAISASEFRPRR